ASAAMLPDAPALFSTTNGCPSRRDTWSATMRVTVSTPPPADTATTILTGRLGYGCACALARLAASNMIAMADRRLMHPPDMVPSATRQTSNPISENCKNRPRSAMLAADIAFGGTTMLAGAREGDRGVEPQ